MRDKEFKEMVKDHYKIKDERLAEELAKQIKHYIEARGLQDHFEGLKKSFGSNYATKEMFKEYDKKVYNR